MVMPFHDPRWPAIQVGLLKAIAESHGFPTATLHLNLDLAADMGQGLYHELSEHDRARHVGDWLFSPAAFGAAAPDLAGEFLRRLRRPPRARRGAANRARALARRWRRPLSGPPGRGGAVGRLPCRRLHVDLRADGAVARPRRPPQAPPARRRGRLRGRQLRGPDGRRAGQDDGVRRLRRHRRGRRRVPRPPRRAERGPRSRRGCGVLACRRDGTVVDGGPAEPVERLDELPTPDYGEYFRRAAELGIVPEHLRHRTWLPAQSARGCWWGEHRHCTFCGLNGSTMAYRSKSPARVRRELAELAARHGTLRFYFVDNILDRRYIDELLPALQRRTGSTTGSSTR